LDMPRLYLLPHDLRCLVPVLFSVGV